MKGCKLFIYFFAFSSALGSPARVVGGVFGAVVVTVAPQKSLGGRCRSCAAAALLPAPRCLPIGGFQQHTVQYVSCKERSKKVADEKWKQTSETLSN